MLFVIGSKLTTMIKQGHRSWYFWYTTENQSQERGPQKQWYWGSVGEDRTYRKKWLFYQRMSFIQPCQWSSSLPFSSWIFSRASYGPRRIWVKAQQDNLLYSSSSVMNSKSSTTGHIALQGKGNDVVHSELVCFQINLTSKWCEIRLVLRAASTRTARDPIRASVVR